MVSPGSKNIHYLSNRLNEKIIYPVPVRKKNFILDAADKFDIFMSHHEISFLLSGFLMEERPGMN
jgi:hypothetical protein